MRRFVRYCILAAVCAVASPQENTPTAIFTLVAEAREKTTAGAWADAARLWERITVLNPSVGSYWEQLGETRLKAGMHSEAVAAFEKALELGANYPGNTAYSIAVCHALAGDKESALTWLGKALALRYRNAHALLDDERLVTLRDDPRLRELAMSYEHGADDRVAGWRHDLRFVARELQRRHYDPFKKVTKASFDAAVARLHDAIPNLRDEQVQVGLMRIARMMGDSHTYVRPASLVSIPVEMFLFEEGLHVIRAAPEYDNLVGRRIDRIGPSSIEQLLKELDSIVSQDNPQWMKTMAPELMTYPAILFGLGVIPERDQLTVTYSGADGQSHVVTLRAQEAKSKETWVAARQESGPGVPLHLRNIARNYWFEHLSRQQTLYLQINAVRNAADEPFGAFVRRAIATAEGVDRLVIDLRWNTGGTRTLNHHLVHALIRAEHLNKRGKLYVIVGRHTASAAMCLAAEIERHTNAIFVGEPTGSSPNFIGQDVPIVLPYSRMRGSISDLYWQNSTALDYRIWIAPEIYVPHRFADYRANRDAAMDAIVGYAHDVRWSK